MVYRQNHRYRAISYGGFALALVVLLLVASGSLFDFPTRMAVLILDGFILIVACVYFYLSLTE